MVEYKSVDLDRVFFAVADPTRRAILEKLRRGPARVTEIARPFRVSLNAVSKHLRVLERAGLIERDVRGRDHYCHLMAAPLHQASAWLGHYREFWEARLDALEEHLEAKRRKKMARD
jgi:DNA-binding transcriptional ArsR family regulator